MTIKKKSTTETGKPASETWRKPLQVPPRTNPMRDFYKRAEEESTDSHQPKTKFKPEIEKGVAEDLDSEPLERTVLGAETPGKLQKLNLTPKIENPTTPLQSEATHKAKANLIKGKLTESELTGKLGIDIEDLFDVHELLRGKSFNMYQVLTKTCDEQGRCKITQPELMKRTGIKNRRTFYKHEEWLIGLNLLEKRHLPGDHKGVVYRVVEISKALPITDEMNEKFKKVLAGSE